VERVAAWRSPHPHRAIVLSDAVVVAAAHRRVVALSGVLGASTYRGRCGVAKPYPYLEH